MDRLKREIESLRHENHILKLEREIASTEHETNKDQTSLSGVSSTPKVGKDSEKKRRVLFDIPKGRPDQDKDMKESPPLLKPYDEQDVNKKDSDRLKMQHSFDTPGSSNLDPSPGGKTIMKPATYDGSISWTNYKAHFEACAQLNQWTVEQKVLYLSVSLRGQAQGVFGNLNTRTTGYKELARALEDRFSPPNQTELYRVQLQDRHQKATESMAKLGQDIRRLTNLAYPNAPSDVKETLAKEQFMDALSNSDMRLRIKQARLSDLNDAVRHAVELEVFYRAEKRHQVRTTTTDQTTQEEVITSLQRTVDKLEKMVRDFSKQRYVQPNSDSKVERSFNRESQRSQGYTCPRNFRNNKTKNQTYASSDRPKRACFECGSESHMKRDCPNLKAELSKKTQGMQSEEKHNKIQTYGISSSGLYVTGKIDNITADCLVDTGATLTIVSSKLWEVINSKNSLTPFDTPLVSAAGDTTKVKGRTELSMTFGDLQYSVPVIIADMDIDVVLGFDFMQEQDVSVSVAHRKMIIGKQEFLLQCSGKIGCYRVVLTDRIDIPAGTEIITQRKVNEASISRIGIGLVEPSETSILDGKGLVARALVKADGTIPLRIANFSMDTQTLYPGTDIARISKIQGIQEIDRQNQPESTIPAHLKMLFERTTVGMVKKEKKEVIKLLSKYSHIFSESDSDLGRSGIIKHQIPTGEARPIKQPMRRIPVHLRDEVDQQIDRMLEENIIQPSTSPWASGIVIVKKKDGTSRFCVDYRRLNDVTIKDAYPLPRIDESLDQLAGSKWFSCLDLNSGFWQVEMHEDDKQKKAFTTRRGLYEFNVMLFGLTSAPATFERLMEVVLAGLHWKICLIYLDDIIVIGKTFEDMINNLDCVFKRFEDSGLKLKPGKCQLFRREVEFLGHIVNESGVGTDPKKIECIKKWPTPTSVTEIHSFLGLCSYYRRFIEGYSKIAKPLHCLAEKSKNFEWTLECEKAFTFLKHLLITAPILSHPDFSLPFILDTDASDFANGAVLLQNVNGAERVVAYASRTLSKSERKYCVTRKEMLALVYFTKYFKHYLDGRKFTARTDHGSLKFKNPEGQVARWLEILSSFDMIIEHKRGRLHSNADGLSRIPCRQCGISDDEKIKMKTEEGYLSIRPIASLNIDDPVSENMEILQEEDRDLRTVIVWLSAKRKPPFNEIASENYRIKSLWNQFERLDILDGVLVRKWDNFETNQMTYQTLVPHSERKKVLAHAHDIKPAGHLGIGKTLSKVRQRFYWPGLQEGTRTYVAGCEICMKRKGPTKTKQAPMQIVRSGYPMERIAIDILGELPETEQGNRYIVVIGDCFTKWTECFPLPNMEASTVAKTLVEEVITRFGIPRKIHSDQGRQFELKLFQEMCQLLNIEKTRTTPYHPESDGMVERFNRTLTAMLSAYVNENHRNWDEQIPYVLMAYRSVEHETTGMLMLGREVSTPLDLLYEMPSGIKPIPDHEWVWVLRERLEIAHSIVRDNTGKAIKRQKQIHDKRNSYEQFEIGGDVYVLFPVKKAGTSSKLTSYWRGPYKILGKVSEVLYKVNCGPGVIVQVIHCDRIRKCKKQTLRNETESLSGDDISLGIQNTHETDNDSFKDDNLPDNSENKDNEND